jgi:uncharacterized membrane protein YdfJ with MMPL/SSD domain
VLALCGVAVILAAVFGASTPHLLNARNDFQDPGSQSAYARMQIERATGAVPTAEVLALVPGGPHSPMVAGVASAMPRMATLRSSVAQGSAVEQLESRLSGRRSVILGGSAVAHYELGRQASDDLSFAELLAFPLLALLALLIFRGGAALLPLAVGATSVLGAFAGLRAVNAALPLSVFALNVVIGLGLGLAVDYSLFLVSRFREQIGAGQDVAGAVRRTMSTAGRTVLFSSLTVAVAIASLTVFPLRFLQSMGIGGALVALVAAGASLTLVPALFALFGERLGRRVPRPVHTGRWYRLAQRVLRRPGSVAGVTAALLLAVASPALRTHWAGTDASVLPPGQSARVADETLARYFPGVQASAAVIAVRASATQRAAVDAYARRVGRADGVQSVGRPRFLGSDTWSLSAALPGPAISSGAQRALAAIRSVPAPFVADVAGDAATFADQRSAIASHLPLALAILAAGTLLILWLMTGSVILPLWRLR